MQSPERRWLKLYPPGYEPDIKVPDLSALDMFEASAARYPHAPAFHYFDGTLAYSRIDGMANQLAHGLLSLGIKKGDRIIVQLQNIPQFLIAAYGIWKAGAIAVPLNPMYKERELEFYAQDCGASGAITMEACYAAISRILPQTGIRWIITTSELDFFQAEGELPEVLRGSVKQKPAGALDLLSFISQFPATPCPAARPAAADVAYLTYTSGTTGPPKGAMNTHGNIVFAAHCVRMLFKLGQADKVLALAPFIHVTGSVTILAAASLVGIPVIACYRFDAQEMLRLAEKWQATFSAGPPTAYLSLMNHSDISKRDLSSLTRLNSGGAALSPAFFRQFEQVTGKAILNGYGLTETTSPAIVTPFGLRDPVDSTGSAVAIGMPIAGTLARIADIETGAELPPGSEGEVVIKGPTVIPGYWNKPQETANAIKDGWLYTGDIGKMDDEGWFYIIDRKKDLINASGYKIWPREVEEVLCSHPAVREACVIGVPDSYRGESVKAFVVLNGAYKDKVSPQELAAYCKSQMAAYKYPRAVEIIEEIPKTISGKMLRRFMRDQEIKKSQPPQTG